MSSRFSESSSSDGDATQSDNDAPEVQGAVDSAYGALRTISFTDLARELDAMDRAQLGGDATVVPEAAHTAHTAKRSTAKRRTGDRTAKRRAAAVGTGIASSAKYTFGVARWSVSTTLTWLFRAAFWIIPTTIGFMLNALAAILVLMVIKPSGFWGYLLAFVLLTVAAMIPGAILAAGQAFAMKSVFGGSGTFIWWILTLAGNFTGLPLGACLGWHFGSQIGGNTGIGIGALIGLLIFGAVIGCWQAYILMYLNVTLWWLWVLPSSLGTVIFVLGVVLTTSSQQVDFFSATLVGGLVYGVFTGVSLVLLLRKAVKLNRMLAANW